MLMEVLQLANNTAAFMGIVASVLSSVAKAEPCPDQYVGLVRDLAQANDFPQRLPAEDRPQGVRAVILVIESPHIREYQGPPGPAKGKTGENIRAYLRDVLNSHTLDDHGLILINAIRYQCSLGVPTRVFRDQVFRQAWLSFGRSDFKNRLTNVYSEGDILVNGCTKGNTKDETLELRRMVEAAIHELWPQSPTGSDERVYHPSSWHFAQNRTGRWP